MMAWFFLSRLARREHADVVLILDESGSIEPDNFYTLLEFVKELVYDLQPSSTGTGVGVVSFSNSVRVHVALRQYASALSVVDAMTFRYRGGTTRTSDALKHVCDDMFGKDGDRSRVRNIAVLFTDGNADDVTATITEARKCRQKGVTILVVSTGNKNRRSVELTGISSYPKNKNILMVKESGGLSSILVDLRDTLTNGEIRMLLIYICTRSIAWDHTFIHPTTC